MLSEAEQLAISLVTTGTTVRALSAVQFVNSLDMSPQHEIFPKLSILECEPTKLTKVWNGKVASAGGWVLRNDVAFHYKSVVEV